MNEDLTPIREQIVAWRLEVECPECGGVGMEPQGSGMHVGTRPCKRCVGVDPRRIGTRKVQHPLVAAVSLAETVACKHCKGSGTVLWAGPHPGRISPRYGACPECPKVPADPETLKLAYGTGRVLRAVNADDPISSAEACGRLLTLRLGLSTMVFDGVTLWWHDVFVPELVALDLSAAYETLLSLLKSMTQEAAATQ